MNQIEEIVEQSLLYDFYGDLLTENRRRVYEAVVFSDLSLSEVAEQEGITRQGVFDMLKRTNKALAAYEEKLGLVEKFSKTKSALTQIRRLLDDAESGGDAAADRRKIRDLTDEIESIL